MELLFLIVFATLIAFGLYLVSKAEKIVDTAREQAEELSALKMENALLKAENIKLKEITISNINKGE